MEHHVREQRLAEATEALSEVADRWDRRLRTIKHLAEQAHAADRSISPTPAQIAPHVDAVDATATRSAGHQVDGVKDA